MAAPSLETSASIYPSEWRHIKEDLDVRQDACENINYFIFNADK